MNKLLFLTLLTTITLHSSSQPGRLDPLFDRDGIQTTTFLKGNVLHESGEKILQQADGKILVAFSLSFDQGVVARYLSNGALDVSYGTGGFTRIVSVGFTDAKLQSDGKLVAIGNSYGGDGDYGIMRFKTNGTPDSSFGINGKQVTNLGFYEQPSGVALQTNGKIVVVGSAGQDFGLVRYNSNGSLDNTFSGDGKQFTNFGFYDEASGVAIQPDGKIVVVGSTAADDQGQSLNFGIARYNTNGVLDNTFSGDGKQTSNFGFDDYPGEVAIQPDGKIVVVGGAYTSEDFASKGNFAIARYTPTGAPDLTFSGDGRQTTDLYGEHDGAGSIALQPDGKLLVAGITARPGPDFNYGIVRYNTNGSLDLSFSGDGKQEKNVGSYDAARSVLLQADGKILLAGETFNDSDYDLGIIRYSSAGVLDPGFSGDGLLLSFLPTEAPVVYTSAALQADGKLVAAGYVQHKVTGSPGNRDFAIARYHPNGLLDNSFDFNGKLTSNLGSSDVANAISIQADGKIVVAGESNGRIALARYLSNGALDNSFNSSGKVFTTVATSAFATSLAIQPNGKIVVSGGALGPASDFVVVRYNANGTLDNTFSGDGKLTTDFGDYEQSNAVAIQNDGKILAVGITTQEDRFVINFALARYNSNGTPDVSFSGDGKVLGDFVSGGFQNDPASVALQADGKMLVAGSARSELNTTFLLVRYNTNGTRDNTYSGDGVFNFQFSEQDGAYSVVIQPDGKSLVGGYANGSQFAIARVRTNGTLDPTFGTGGKQLTNIPLIPSQINQLVLSGQRVYAAGGYPFGGNLGVAAAYQLGTTTATVSASHVAQNDQALVVSVLPNPAKDFFTVVIQHNETKRMNIRVVDVMGRLVEQKLATGPGNIEIGHSYSAGIYFIQVSDGNEKLSFRCIKR